MKANTYAAKFSIIRCPAFFLRTSPQVSSANPACMNSTRYPVFSVQAKFVATRMWPTASASLTASGSLSPGLEFVEIFLVLRIVGSRLVGRLGDNECVAARRPPLTSCHLLARPAGSGLGLLGQAGRQRYRKNTRGENATCVPLRNALAETCPRRDLVLLATVPSQLYSPD